MYLDKSCWNTIELNVVVFVITKCDTMKFKVQLCGQQPQISIEPSTSISFFCIASTECSACLLVAATSLLPSFDNVLFTRVGWKLFKLSFDLTIWLPAPCPLSYFLRVETLRATLGLFQALSKLCAIQAILAGLGHLRSNPSTSHPSSTQLIPIKLNSANLKLNTMED